MIVGSLFFTPDLTNFIFYFLLKDIDKSFVLFYDKYFLFKLSNNI